MQKLRYNAKRGIELSGENRPHGEEGLGRTVGNGANTGLMAGMFDRVGPPKAELLRSVSEWAELRASLQVFFLWTASVSHLHCACTRTITRTAFASSGPSPAPLAIPVHAAHAVNSCQRGPA